MREGWIRSLIIGGSFSKGNTMEKTKEQALAAAFTRLIPCEEWEEVTGESSGSVREMDIKFLSLLTLALGNVWR